MRSRSCRSLFPPVVLGVLLAACADEGGITPPADSPSYAGPLTATTPSNPQSPPAQGDYSPDRPNEPDGYVKWLEHDFSTLPDGQLSHGGVASPSYGGAYTIINDSAMSNGKALRIRFGQGAVSGASPGRFSAFNAGNSQTSLALKEWYISVWIL